MTNLNTQSATECVKDLPAHHSVAAVSHKADTEAPSVCFKQNTFVKKKSTAIFQGNYLAVLMLNHIFLKSECLVKQEKCILVKNK